MAKWESSDDFYVESVEELLDTNPDLYKQRTIQALREKRFRDAIQEALAAKKYGNEALEYQVLMLRVLFEMGDYSVCMQYFQRFQLWAKRDDKDLLPDEQSYIYYTFGVCYRECGYDVSRSPSIIVTPDGRGMYPTIHEAIANSKEGQEILLVGACYTENRDGISEYKTQHVNFQEKMVTINHRNINIRGIGNAELSSCVNIMHSAVNMSQITLREIDEKYALYISEATGDTKAVMMAQNSLVTLNDITYRVNKDNLFGLAVVDDSKVYLKNCAFVELGFGVGNEGHTTIEKCQFRKCKSGILTGKGTLAIENGSFCDCVTGVLVAAETTAMIEKSLFERCEIGVHCGVPEGFNEHKVCSKIQIVDSKFRFNSSVAILAIAGGNIEVIRCDICNNIVGVAAYVEGEKASSMSIGEVRIVNSEIHHNSTNLSVYHKGNMKIEDSTIASASVAGIRAVGNGHLDLINCRIVRNRVDFRIQGNPEICEIDCKREDNNFVASTVDATKSQFREIGEGIWGKNFTAADVIEDVIQETTTGIKNVAKMLGSLFR